MCHCSKCYLWWEHLISEVLPNLFMGRSAWLCGCRMFSQVQYIQFYLLQLAYSSQWLRIGSNNFTSNRTISVSKKKKTFSFWSEPSGMSPRKFSSLTHVSPIPLKESIVTQRDCRKCINFLSV